MCDLGTGLPFTPAQCVTHPAAGADFTLAAKRTFHLSGFAFLHDFAGAPRCP